MLQINQAVTWTTSNTTKIGTIVGFVAALENADKILRALYSNVSNSQMKFDQVSTQNRVLIRVDRTGWNGKALVPHFYAPSQKLLERQVAQQQTI